MNGYGSHTFKMVNAAGEANYVKVWRLWISKLVKIHENQKAGAPGIVPND